MSFLAAHRTKALFLAACAAAFPPHASGLSLRSESLRGTLDFAREQNIQDPRIHDAMEKLFGKPRASCSINDAKIEQFSAIEGRTASQTAKLEQASKTAQNYTNATKSVSYKPTDPKNVLMETNGFDSMIEGGTGAPNAGNNGNVGARGAPAPASGSGTMPRTNNASDAASSDALQTLEEGSNMASRSGSLKKIVKVGAKVVLIGVVVYSLACSHMEANKRKDVQVAMINWFKENGKIDEAAAEKLEKEARNQRTQTSWGNVTGTAASAV